MLPRHMLLLLLLTVSLHFVISTDMACAYRAHDCVGIPFFDQRHGELLMVSDEMGATAAFLLQHTAQVEVSRCMISIWQLL